ncbi:ZNFX1 protein, partial [Polypterus senegalus]
MWVCAHPGSRGGRLPSFRAGVRWKTDEARERVWRRPEERHIVARTVCWDSESRRGGYHRIRGRSPANLLNLSLDTESNVTGWTVPRVRSHSTNWRISGDEVTETEKPKYRVTTLDFRILTKIYTMESSDLVMKLASPGSGLQEFLSQNELTEELTDIALKVLGKACRSKTNRHNLQHLLTIIKDSVFLKRILPMFVMNITKQSDTQKRQQSLEQLNEILVIHLTLISVFPSSTVIDVSLIATLVRREIDSLQISGQVVSEEIENNMKNLQRIIEHLQERKREGTLRSDNYTYIIENLNLDIEDFRQMSVFPTYEDIHIVEKPFMRPNIIGQKFQDTNTYLDTHFRLLREDFIKPLRDGISQLLHYGGKNLHKQRFDDIRVYSDTCIVAPICTHNGILYRVHFNNSNLKLVQWESSKRLLFGALVCLSKDNFETMMFATIANRDVKELAEGLITLSFTEESRLKLADVRENDSFLMVETSAFFEAYRHVLEGLQEMSVADLAMQQYIVNCDTGISPPKYFLGNHNKYNFKSLVNDRQDFIKDRELYKDRSDPEDYSSSFSNVKILQALLSNSKCNVLDLNAWPSKEKFKFDESQLQAVQTALTQELAIIQGPPGTGKTYVGLKIVASLLDNSNFWNPNGGCPILVVCYTNHALDQFMEGILEFLPRRGILPRKETLVRIGGRCSSDKLKTYCLNNMRREKGFKQNLPGHLRALYSELKDVKDLVEMKIKESAALFESAGKGVLHENVLEEYVVSLHGTTLKKTGDEEGYFSSRKKDSCLMLEWLGISLLNQASRQTEIVERDIPEKTPKERDDKNPDDPYDTEETVDYESESVIDSEDEESNESEKEQSSDDETSLNPEVQGIHEDDLAQAEELLKSADFLEQDIDELSDVVSVATQGDVADLTQVMEEAEEIQAERMMDGDDVRIEIEKAKKRVVRVQKMILAYVPEEDKQEDDKNNRKKRSAQDEEWQFGSDKKGEVLKSALLSFIEALWQVWEERLWLKKYRNSIKMEMLENENNYQKIVDRIKELRNQEDLTILRMANIIGMTTTGAARCRKIVQDIQPKVVVVEEAAEVLEAHIVTTLTAACEHLILIGDHQQLRPSATVYELAKNFNLEVSLFERLIRMGIPYVRLNYQHRMRPEIAKLLTPHIYDKLENHQSVYLYDKIKGVNSNLFFVEHEHLEETIHEGRSHQNVHEATFVKSLCKYFINQGYLSSTITVLTTYTGQFHYLRKIMKNDFFNDIKIRVVDKYQGEENDIIILSLVRSNLEGRVGFLQIPNRICVALSRARKGLFCIGNFKMLSKVPLWSNILNVVSMNDQIGKYLVLQCENHPKNVTFASEAEDFKKVPEGGCMLPCEFRLRCGHVCTRLCHPYDSDHSNFKCVKPCQKIVCTAGHKCTKKCFDKCGQCQVLVSKTIPKCGHLQNVPCSLPADKFICTEPCTKTLECGHQCCRICGETCTYKCPKNVTIDLGCGHEKSIVCLQKEDILCKKISVSCLVPCETLLNCGHQCTGNCSKCSKGTSHPPCSIQCEKLLLCSHPCEKQCGEDCIPCLKLCENKCFHGKCIKKCCQACIPCTKPCGWQCSHHKCTNLCYEPCDREPCQYPCRRKLKCKHACIGMCGEPCPRKCRICNAEEVQELFFGREADPDARFIQLMNCNHIFEVTGFDSWMFSPEPSGVIKLKCCPKCNTPIRRSVRYASLVKKTLLEIEQVKRMVFAKSVTSTLQFLEDSEIEINFPEMAEVYRSKLEEPDLGMKFLTTIQAQLPLLSKLSDIKSTSKLILPAHKYEEKICKRIEECSVAIAKGKFRGNNMEIQEIILLIEALKIQSMYLTSANWPSWYGIQDDSSVGEAAGSLPPAPSYSHLDVPPPYEVVTGDDLKPPPYSEYALGEAATDLQETCDNCSISDAPPPYTPFPLTEIHLHTEATCNSEALENNSVPTTLAQD